MHMIEVDFDVFKALTLRRSSEKVTENDILRDLLGLPPRHPEKEAEQAAPREGWTAKGVHFPAGAEFRAHYRGQLYLARVEQGALMWNGERFDSPSAAAMKITGNNVNGWNFWECRFPGQPDWRIIKALRKSK